MHASSVPRITLSVSLFLFFLSPDFSYPADPIHTESGQICPVVPGATAAAGERKIVTW
jgi:hypothetical protein